MRQKGPHRASQRLGGTTDKTLGERIGPTLGAPMKTSKRHALTPGRKRQLKSGRPLSYGPTHPWYQALKTEGHFNQGRL